MRKYLPIVVTLFVLGIIAYIMIEQKNKVIKANNEIINNIGTFDKVKICSKPPQILQRLNIPQPVIIDLSQKKYTGIAFHFGKNYEKVLQKKQWKQFEHFSTYTSDKKGNIYLVPTPYISIKPTTFNLQKNIYKLDSYTGNISIFMHFDDVHPSPNNPYGINAITYDCEDNTLWVAAIDESTYQTEKGVIYHIDIATKTILQTVQDFDVLTMSIVKSSKGKYLLVGSAKNNGLYAYTIYNGRLNKKPLKLLELPSANEHIRKIKIKEENTIELQTISFSYTLIAQTTKDERSYYDFIWNESLVTWILNKN